MAILGADVWVHGRQLEAAEKRITKATKQQVKARVESEVTKSKEKFEKELLASVAKIVQEEVTPIKATLQHMQEEITPMKASLQHIQGRMVYLDSASMKMTKMLLANCQKKK